MRTHFLLAIGCLLAALAGGCGGGSGGTPPGDPNRVGAGWITISGQGSTDSPTTVVGGQAFISPTHRRCCTGNASDTGVTVTWSNTTTGDSGAALQTPHYGWLFQFFLSGHSWSASIPVVLGSNDITVTATDPSGNLGRATITVTRVLDTTPPTITSTTPTSGALGVAVDGAIQARFSEPVQSSTVDTASFFVVDSNGVPVSGMVSSSGSIATFTPSSNLAPATRYTSTVTTAIRDLGGNALATQTSWNFTTGINTWQSMSSAGGPGARTAHTAVWTGSEVIVWGGNASRFSNSPLNSGSRYRPATDSWVSMSINIAPSARLSHTAIWTGTEMIVWGGWDGVASLGTGGRYNPTNNTWQPVSAVNAPSARSSHTAVWTGTEMIVWGGSGGSGALVDGGRYNPLTGTWQPVTALDPALARQGHTAVWTGSRMIIWGGWNGTTAVNTGAAYDPTSDTWQVLGTFDAPTARVAHTAVWTGMEMAVWGGWDFSLPVPNYFFGGGRYDPVGNGWQTFTMAGAPSGRVGHEAVWTGSEMIVWGGTTGPPATPTYLDSGGRYAPAIDNWQLIATANAPSARSGHTATWTGTEVILWGGVDANAVLNSGGRYVP